MTDATAGRGGVGIRLYVSGGEVVKRTFDQVGDSGKKMWAEIALGEKAANPAIKVLSAGAGEAKGALEGLAGRAGSAGTALSAFGATGMAVAAGMGALAIALVKVREGMQFAAELTDVSDRIGIGAEALQEWRYVADEAGVSVESFQSNLEKLNGQVGAFKAGIGDAKLKPIFEELGITKDQIANVDDASDMVMLLADTLGQVKDRAVQVRLARGLGFEESLPILRLGSEEIRRLSADARDLGLVMKDDVRAELDEADRVMERAQQRIQMSLRVAVAGLADDFADLVTVVADLIGWLGKLNSMAVKVSVDLPGRALADVVSDGIRGRSAAEGNAARDAGLYTMPRWMKWMGFGQQRRAQLDAEMGNQMAGAADFATGAGSGGFDLRGHSGRGGGGANNAAREAERRAEQKRQREEQAADRLSRLERETNRAWDRSTHLQTIESRARGQIEDLELERAERLKEIGRAEEEYVRSKGLRGLTEAEGALLRQKTDELVSVQQSLASETERRELAARRLKTEEDAAQSATELLDIDAQMARTQGERHRIEREILLATIEIARRRKAFELNNDPELDDEQRGQQMGVFNRGATRRVKLFDHQETERLRAQFKSYGREVTDAIREGRIGEYIGDQLKQRLLDGALDQLFNLFKGSGSSGGGSGGGNWLSTAFNVAKSAFSKGAGRAAGGDTWAGSSYPVVEHGKPELFMIGGAGHVTSAVETARMLRETMAETGGAAGASAAPVVHMPGITIHAPGADPVALKRVEDKLDKLQRDMPGMAVRAVNEARQRNHGG
ncbi:hypothetical protein WKI27_00680 [Brevundimonas vesicularis]|uniref:hypothetical protein n=1 Tax=Brevundimonas vesicularis TaxID=41276 RepID=UPI0030BA4AFC